MVAVWLMLQLAIVYKSLLLQQLESVACPLGVHRGRIHTPNSSEAAADEAHGLVPMVVHGFPRRDDGQEAWREVGQSASGQHVSSFDILQDEHATAESGGNWPPLPKLVIFSGKLVLKSDEQPPGDQSTAYWLIVAASIAYVATVTLLVWLPAKCLLYRRSGPFCERTTWRPVTLAYVILSTLPCFAFLIASSQVQVHFNKLYDTFCELPASLILLSLIAVDIVERIRPCRLTGSDDLLMDACFLCPMVTPLEQVSTVTGQLDAPGDRSWAGDGPGANGWAAAHSLATGRQSSAAASEACWEGPLGRLCAADLRAELVVQAFLFWLDSAEMLRVVALPPVYLSGWVFPIYIVSYLSSLRVVAAPHSPCLSAMGVWLQDLPYLILRVSLTATFGLITPVLYLVKNLLVTLAFIYFNYITKLKIFNTGHMF
ncbi:transmembrane protein 236-like isoform X1 [Paramormyrops kingsleyae]|uniref:transmembrane protein 236-like isoform X1 n=1 Tax=Paramormyrops kingsleyae TaxID=1676925 RepID=UPI003B972C1C